MIEKPHAASYSCGGADGPIMRPAARHLSSSRKVRIAVSAHFIESATPRAVEPWSEAEKIGVVHLEENSFPIRKFEVFSLEFALQAAQPNEAGENASVPARKLAVERVILYR